MTSSNEVIIEIIADEGVDLPTYGSDLAAGADVRANISESMILTPHEIVMVPTGLRLAIPEGYEVQVRPRSGLAAKHGVTVLNSPGTIDADYRGEVKIILINHGHHPFKIEPGMRVAQLVVAPVVQANFAQALSLSTTGRGEGGFGHTGVH